MLSMYSLHTLSNNLKVVTIPMETASATVLVLMGAGSRYEKKAEGGLSHFIEHMMFKGTKNRPTAREIAQEIDGIGGEFNAYTAKDHTGYWIKAASEHIPFLIEMLSDMTLNSLLDDKEIDREKGVIIEEMNMYEDTPMRKVSEVYEQLLYGDTPLGRDIIGTKETVSSFSRENFQAYMERLYRPNNAVIIIAGGMGKIPVVDHIQKHFGSWSDKKTPTFEKQTEKQKAPNLKIISKKTEQTHICIGVRAFGLSDPRRYSLSLLSVILGGGMSSRLFHEVRERRGLAYYVHSSADKYQEVGNFVTQAGIDSAKVEEAVKVIVDEYFKITNYELRIKDKELEKAKAFLKGHLVLGLEDSHGVAGFFGDSLLLEGKVRSVDEVISRVEAVTVEDVVNVAKDIFKKENLNIAAIGPFKEGIEEKIGSLVE